MTNTKRPAIWIVIALFSLTIANSYCKNNSNTNNKNTSFPKDSLELTGLVIRLYEWNETKNNTSDFRPEKTNDNDSSYSGINWDAHIGRMKELDNTGFFSKEFLENYDTIAKTIDQNLKNGEMQWLVGDIPPFGGDANPWCRCQDIPYDNYWKDLKLSNIDINKNRATYEWNWISEWENKYKVGAIRIGKVWKISYLQGFDYELFLSDK